MEFQSAEALKADDLKDLSDRVGLVLSYHNFKNTKKLDEQFAEMNQYPADFYKLVTTATNLYDNVVMMKFLEANSAKHEMVGLCMGEQGIISRVLGVRAGSIFTFGAATKGEETAPGQVLAGELRDVYRIEIVDQATQVYGVAGDPISIPFTGDDERRLSPRNGQCGLPRAARQESEGPAGLRAGHSYSRPQHHHAYKQDIVDELENSDPLTRQIGACNTVVRAADGSSTASIPTWPEWWFRWSSGCIWQGRGF